MEAYLKEVEKMREGNADFNAYYHKLLDGIKNIEGNDKAILVYSILDAVRDLGKAEGRTEIRRDIDKLLSKP